MRGPGLLMIGLLLFASTSWTQEPAPSPESPRPTAATTWTADASGKSAEELIRRGDELARLRGRGATRVALGATLLSLGVLFGATSSALWIDGSADANRYNAFVGQFQGAVAMDVIGLSMIGAGTALLAIGVGNMAEANRPRLYVGAAAVGARF